MEPDDGAVRGHGSGTRCGHWGWECACLKPVWQGKGNCPCSMRHSNIMKRMTTVLVRLTGWGARTGRKPFLLGRSRAPAREIEGIATTSCRRNGDAGTVGHQERRGPSAIVGKPDEPRRFSPVTILPQPSTREKLPTLTFPTFNGEPLVWTPFGDGFLAAVDENERLAQVE